ncbi:MAG: hypothetical protein ACE3L7_02055 [Candidatus Pristimantibacillus sp.]
MDNHKNKVQFCRELGAIVFTILGNSEALLSVSQELLELYKPKSREEASMFYSLRFDLPDSAELLCNIRNIDLSDDDEFYDSVSPLRDMALDVANRMVSANVIVTDIIIMYAEPHDDDMYIHLYLTVLRPISNSIRYVREKLDKFHKELGQRWPELLVLDDEVDDEVDDEADDEADEEEDSVLPGEVESFQLMRNILAKTLNEYIKDHKSERIYNYILDIEDYLENFAKGIEPDKEFCFGFVWKSESGENRDLEYMDFNFESGMIQVSSGGSVYNEGIGSDSYTNWTYIIWLDGWCKDNEDYYFTNMLGLVRSGARLSIESPYEYTDEMENV